MLKELLKSLSTPTKSKSDRFVMKTEDIAEDPFTIASTPTRKGDGSTATTPAHTMDQFATATIAPPGQNSTATRETAQDVYPADACIFVAK